MRLSIEAVLGGLVGGGSFAYTLERLIRNALADAVFHRAVAELAFGRIDFGQDGFFVARPEVRFQLQACHMRDDFFAFLDRCGVPTPGRQASQKWQKMTPHWMSQLCAENGRRQVSATKSGRVCSACYFVN